ncbi:MAG: ATP-binding protein [Micrococcaceae bacterium]
MHRRYTDPLLAKNYLAQKLVRTEDPRLEFKEARLQFDMKKLAQYCVAISNIGGGDLFLGVSDRLPRSVVGTEAFNDTNDTEMTLRDRLGFKVEIEEIEYEGKRVLRFIIPPRPRGTPRQLEGAYLTRTGESLTGMTEDELRSIFSETALPYEQEEASESLPSSGVFERLHCDGIFDLLQEPRPASSVQQLKILERIGLIKRSQIEDEWIILKLGALVAARDLETFQLQTHKLRVLRYEGSGRLHAVTDKLFDSGYGLAMGEALEFLSAMMPRREEFSEAHRKDVHPYPQVALRELLANALVHQDFHALVGSNYPTVEVFADRIEISNGGEPLIDVRKFVTENAQRNRDLADMMRRLGLAENRGSGVDRTLAAFEEIHGAAPEFISETVSTRVILRGSLSWEQMGPNERQWATYMHCCLKWANGSHMTNSSLRERFGLPKSKVASISNLIAELVKLQVIIIDPRGPAGNRSRRYIPFA